MDLARRLKRVLAVLAAKAAAPEHFELRLAEALAGNLADQLEAIEERCAPSGPPRRSAS